MAGIVSTGTSPDVGADIATPEIPVIPAAPGPQDSAPRTRGKVRWWRIIVLTIMSLYVIVPLAAAFKFTVYNPNLHQWSFTPYTSMFSAPGFLTSVRMTTLVALTTIVLEFLLLVPAMVAIHLRLPRLRPVIESLAMVPLVLSPIALVAGMSTVLGWGLDGTPGSPLFRLDADLQNQSFPLILPLVYVVITLPFAFRSLEAGLRAVDLKTLVEASRGLGASWPQTLGRVVLPNLRTGLLSGAILTLALVFGEYTIASILQFTPFAVWIAVYGQSGGSGELPVAVSLLSLALSWLVLFLVSFLGGRKAAAATARRA